MGLPHLGVSPLLDKFFHPQPWDQVGYSRIVQNFGFCQQRNFTEILHKPLDKQKIIASVKKTGKLIIMDEEPKTGSAAAEIAALVADEAFDCLRAPIKRVCAPDTPVPFSPPLEKFWMPDEDDLVKAVNETLNYS